MDRTLSKNKRKRPIAITVICILGFACTLLFWGVFLSYINAFFRAFQKIGTWYFPYMIFSTIIGVVCFVGLWHMRKWALYVYTVLGAINLIVLIALHTSLVTIIVSIIFISIMWLYKNRMK
jgi:hypothetical protein